MSTRRVCSSVACIRVAVATSLLFVAASSPARAADQPVSQETIQAAIAKGQAFLLSQMKAPGRWETDAQRKGNKHDHEHMQGSTWGGFTAIATYALLASGKHPQDKDVAAAINFLKSADITGAYALGLRAQVWSHLPRGPEIVRLYNQDAAALIRTINKGGAAAAMWDYDDPTNRPSNRIDHSLSQYGVLGLWACAQGGAEINPEIWAAFDGAWRKHQYASGGWSYKGDGKDADPVTPR